MRLSKTGVQCPSAAARYTFTVFLNCSKCSGVDSKINSPALLRFESYTSESAQDRVHGYIGGKLVFARYLDRDGEAFYKVSMIYQSTQQLRELSLLSLDNPPMEALLHFSGAETNADDMIAEDDLLALFDKAISAYDLLKEAYSEETLAAAA